MTDLTIPIATVDWCIVAGYFVLAIGLGFVFSRRATQNIDEYFVAGRSLPWWIAGTSMVATSFAADTPLAIAGVVRTRGLQANWYWWSGVMAFMMTVCLFAKLWHRAHLITDAQIYEQRYEGGAAKVLRCFNAAYRSLIMNCITMGWVLLAGTKIIGVFFDLPTIVFLRTGAVELMNNTLTPVQAGFDPSMILFMADEKLIGVVFCVLVAVTYATVAGMWGVVATDVIQFVIAMVGSISLAVLCIVKLGGIGPMREAILTAIDNNMAAASAEGISNLCSSDTILRFMPSMDAGALAISTFIIFITVQWWGGSEGGGFLAQRIFACKDERHAAMAVLWFSFMHFVVRFWPWIIVGLASIVFFPQIADAEQAYPLMIGFLPVGLKGLMVASLLAAFMSTIDTHLNWGASYLVNDIYKRFMVREGSARHYVIAGQIASVLLMIIAAIGALSMDTIYGGWLYLSEIGSGLILATLLRWFWWRINAWSEISAMVTSLVLANAFRVIGKVFDIPFLAADEWYAIRLVLLVFACTVVWIIVTYLTQPTKHEQLRAFYTRIHPPGFWDPVREPGDPQPEKGHGWRIVRAWAAGVASVYCFLIGVGKILLAEYLFGTVLVIGGVITGYILLKNMLIETNAAHSMPPAQEATDLH